MTKLTFAARAGRNNVFHSTVAEIPATVTCEPYGTHVVYTLRVDFGTEDHLLVGRYRTLESATYAATGFFADDLNALNGVDVPRVRF